MFQDEYKAKFDAIPPDPEFRRQLEERIEEMKAPHVNKRKLSATTVAVLTALLIASDQNAAHQVLEKAWK